MDFFQRTFTRIRYEFTEATKFTLLWDGGTVGHENANIYYEFLPEFRVGFHPPHKVTRMRAHASQSISITGNPLFFLYATRYYSNVLSQYYVASNHTEIVLVFGQSHAIDGM
jgi:hypothetical protein